MQPIKKVPITLLLLSLPLILLIAPGIVYGEAGYRGEHSPHHREDSTQDRKEYTIYRAGTPIVIDGRLDEPAWVGAPDVGRFVFPRYESGKKELTVAKLLWDDTYLYVSFICEDEYIW